MEEVAKFGSLNSKCDSHSIMTNSGWHSVSSLARNKGTSRVCVFLPQSTGTTKHQGIVFMWECVYCVVKALLFLKKLMTWEKFLKYSPKFNCKAGRVEGSRNGEKLNS